MNNIFLDLFYIIYNQVVFLFVQVDFWLGFALVLFLLSLGPWAISYLNTLAINYIANIKHNYQVTCVLVAEYQAKCSTINSLINNFSDEHKLMLEYANEEIRQEVADYCATLQLQVHKLEKSYQEKLLQLQQECYKQFQDFVILQLNIHMQRLFQNSLHEVDYNKFCNKSLKDCLNNLKI